MQKGYNPSSNKCPKCGEYMNDISKDNMFILECPWCFEIIETEMVLYGRKW